MRTVVIEKRGSNRNLGKCAMPFAGVLLALLCALLTVTPLQARASKARISSKKVTLYVGETKTVKILGMAKKIQWKSSKKKVATVTSKGKIMARKAGKATITAKVGKRSFKCSVTVKQPDSARRLKLARQKAKQIIKKYVSSDMNTAERAYVLFRWISDNCSWQKNQSTAAYKKNFGNEAYAALILKKAACSGHAKAYMMLCEMAKVPVRHVNAGSWTHQWNEVKVNGKWLKVDTYEKTFESTSGIRKPILERETYNEEGKTEIPVFSFKVKMG